MTSQEGFGDLSQLMNEIKEARAAIATGDHKRNATVEELRGIIERQGKAIDALSIKMGRPNGSSHFESDDTRAQAIELLHQKYVMRQPKHDPGGAAFTPDEASIGEAALAIKGIRH